MKTFSISVVGVILLIIGACSQVTPSSFEPTPTLGAVPEKSVTFYGWSKQIPGCWEERQFIEVVLWVEVAEATFSQGYLEFYWEANLEDEEGIIIIFPRRGFEVYLWPEDEFLMAVGLLDASEEVETEPVWFPIFRFPGLSEDQRACFDWAANLQPVTFEEESLPDR